MFLTHLMAACAALDPAVPVPSADWPDGLDELLSALDEVLTTECYLVLDDFHMVEGRDVNAVVGRLVERLPRRLHVVITTRERPTVPGLVRWRAAGEVLQIRRSELAFSADEVVGYYTALLRLPITTGQAEIISEETEGWPIAMQLLGERLRAGAEGFEAVFRTLPEGRREIFEYLGDQVLRRQAPAVRSFLEQTACLRTFDVAACAALAATEASTTLLRKVVDAGLFCSSDGTGGYRYHHLFRDFLLAQLPLDRVQANHALAAAHYRARGDLAEAVYHALESCDHATAARDLAELGPRLLDSGRYLNLLEWSAAVPADVRGRFPALLLARSQALRLTSCYRDSLAEARAAGGLFDRLGDAAGMFDAFAAEALVQLDTVQPAKAYRALLAMGPALRVVDSDRRRRWRQMVAENRVNEGRLDLAARAYRRLGQDRRNVRLLVRCGHLHRALTLLESPAAEPAGRVPHSHRERDAMLAWVHALLGDRPAAERHARRGIELGEQLRSPIIACVCASRLGHARLTGDAADAEQALEDYRRALRQAEQIEVPRFRAESLIGLAVGSARLGVTADIWRFGFDALEVVESAGDNYLAALARLAIGASAGTAGHPDAQRWLDAADAGAARCGDRYVPLLARVWSAWLALQRADRAGFALAARAALAAMRTDGLEAVLVRAPWLGLPTLTDRRSWLRSAAALPDVGDYARYLLRRLDEQDVATPAGRAVPREGVRVRLLGGFQVTRDGVEVTSWGRRKARELLWLLCARDSHSVGREEAIELLWPGASLESGMIRLRVALHTLHAALEPERRPRAPTRFVHPTAERIALDSGVWVDTDEFRTLARMARTERDPARALALARLAVDLYRGPFLADAPYLDWAGATRESLRSLFVELAMWAARRDLDRGERAMAGGLARRALDEDAYREEAYQLLARAHLDAGDGAAARRVFDECRARLLTDLGVEPSWGPPDPAATV